MYIEVKRVRAVAQMSSGVYSCKVLTFMWNSIILFVDRLKKLKIHILNPRTTTLKKKKERELVNKPIVEGKRWNI